jgi:hypothetical protein
MNYILQAETLGMPGGLFAVTILGVPLTTFLLVMVFVLGVGIWLTFLMWDRTRLAKNKLESKDRVICEFMSESGGKVWRELLEKHKMEIKAVQTKSRAMFMADAFIKAPKGHAIDAYYALPEHDYLDVWPMNARATQQVTLQKYYFVENDPCPKMPHDPKLWDTDRYLRITAAIAKLAKDESNLQVLVSEMSGVWQNIADFVKKLQMIPLLLLAIGGLGLVCLFTAFMVFQSNQGIQQLVKFLVGK